MEKSHKHTGKQESKLTVDQSREESKKQIWRKISWKKQKTKESTWERAIKSGYKEFWGQEGAMGEFLEKWSRYRYSQAAGLLHNRNGRTMAEALCGWSWAELQAGAMSRREEVSWWRLAIKALYPTAHLATPSLYQTPAFPQSRLHKRKWQMV